MTIQNISTAEVYDISAHQQLQIQENIYQQTLTVASIKGWIIAYLAELLEVDPEDIDPAIPFDRYGLDSSSAVGLTGDLEEWLGHELDPTLLYDYPTIENLAQHLGSTLQT